MERNALDYSEYIEIADGVYWVGYADEKAGLHCNPYLIADHGEAVLIDGGSRDDFSTVMLKVMRAGVTPNRIGRLIYITTIRTCAETSRTWKRSSATRI